MAWPSVPWKLIKCPKNVTPDTRPVITLTPARAHISQGERQTDRDIERRDREETDTETGTFQILTSQDHVFFGTARTGVVSFEGLKF